MLKLPIPSCHCELKIQLYIAKEVGYVKDTEYQELNERYKHALTPNLIQRAKISPYSMINREKAAFTIRNNLISTLNFCYAVKEYAPDCHIIKLGTMGEYGTPNIDIPEGWIEIEHDQKKALVCCDFLTESKGI